MASFLLSTAYWGLRLSILLPWLDKIEPNDYRICVDCLLFQKFKNKMLKWNLLKTCLFRRLRFQQYRQPVESSSSNPFIHSFKLAKVIEHRNWKTEKIIWNDAYCLGRAKRPGPIHIRGKLFAFSPRILLSLEYPRSFFEKCQVALVLEETSFFLEYGEEQSIKTFRTDNMHPWHAKNRDKRWSRARKAYLSLAAKVKTPKPVVHPWTVRSLARQACQAAAITIATVEC